MDEDHPLECAQLLARLEAELVEREPRLLVGGERVDLPTGAVEREHLQPPQPLACRVLAGERLQLADQLGVHAELELRLDPVLERRQPQLLQPPRLGLRERLEREVGERCTAPQLRAPRAARAARSRAGSLARPPAEPLEAPRVDRLRRRRAAT